MLEKLVHTEDDRTLTFLRVILGTVFVAHGAQKMLGWYGGPGFSGAMDMFTQQMNIPAPLAFLAIATEFFGSLALVAGLLGRLAGLAIAVEMVVAVFLVHMPYGFFMNWTGHQGGEGFEYHLLAIAMAMAIAVKGAGAWSLDHLLMRQLAHLTATRPEVGARHTRTDLGQGQRRSRGSESLPHELPNVQLPDLPHVGRARVSEM